MNLERDVVLAVIGDVHGHFTRLERVLERVARETVDAVLFVGDIGLNLLHADIERTLERDARYLHSVEFVLDRARALRVPVHYVPGNHDLAQLELEGNVDGRLVEIAGLRVHGIGGAGPGRFGFPYEWEEDEVRARTFVECDVILAHAPPAETPLDCVQPSNVHVGSVALRERALRHDGVYVCGHIHESANAVEIGRCLCINVGGLGAPYGSAQVGFVHRSMQLAGGWEVVHENLDSKIVRRWERSARAMSGPAAFNSPITQTLDLPKP